MSRHWCYHLHMSPSNTSIEAQGETVKGIPEFPRWTNSLAIIFLGHDSFKMTFLWLLKVARVTCSALELGKDPEKSSPLCINKGKVACAKTYFTSLASLFYIHLLTPWECNHHELLRTFLSAWFFSLHNFKGEWYRKSTFSQESVYLAVNPGIIIDLHRELEQVIYVNLV